MDLGGSAERAVVVQSNDAGTGSFLYRGYAVVLGHKATVRSALFPKSRRALCSLHILLHPTDFTRACIDGYTVVLPTIFLLAIDLPSVLVQNVIILSSQTSSRIAILTLHLHDLQLLHHGTM